MLRGTKYSLPMPKSGRQGNKSNPILREDDKRLLKAAARAKVTRREGWVSSQSGSRRGSAAWVDDT